MSFPPPATDTIDWNDIGFKVREVNGHIECRYSTTTGSWSTPEFVKDPFLRIHGLAPGLNYGQQAYEGLKAFRTPSSDIQIFRPSTNAQRFAHSLLYISCPSPSEELFKQCVHLAVSLNATFVPPHSTGGALYIRPLLFGSSAQLALSPPDEYTFVVYVLPVGVYHGTGAVDALILEDFDRAAPEGTGSAKIGGNYAPVLRHSERARQDGFGITLHLDSRERAWIEEFSTSGFLGVRASTPDHPASPTLIIPDSRSVIESVTSDSCATLARHWNWAVERRPVAFNELHEFDEVLAAGTAAGLVPIKSITHRGRDQHCEYRGEQGAAWKRLLQGLRAVQRGIEPDSFGWCEVVKAPTELGQYIVRGKDITASGVNGCVDKGVTK